MKVLGLTGGIASGKSFAANYFKEKGYTVIDADLITKTLLEDEVVLCEIRNHFKEAFLNGKLNKRILADIIFKNPQEKAILEAIIHPLVYKKIRADVEKYKFKKWVIIDVPLLFETFKADLYDKIMVVYVDYDTQLNRLMRRDDLLKEEAQQRIETQMSLIEKKTKADIVIDNSGSEIDTLKQLDLIIERLV